MASRNQTLPRHTLLAGQGNRTGAFLLDAVIFVVSSVFFLILVFGFVFRPIIAPIEQSYNNEQLNSGLKYEENGELVMIETEAPFEKYRDTLSYFYLSYLTGNDIKENLEPSQETSAIYTVSWFNANVLGIGVDPDSTSDSGLFTYQYKNNEYDKSVLGVPKTSSSAEDVNRHMQKQYIEAFDKFSCQDYINDMVNRKSFLYSLEFVLSCFTGALITYVLFPYIFKNGQTVGKKAFGLALASKDGYKVNNYQIWLRLIPLTVVILSLLVPIWFDLFMVLLVTMVVFLSSFAISMASPKKMALHDLTAGTIVVDSLKSLIFDDSASEEEYIFKEDGIEEVDE